MLCALLTKQYKCTYLTCYLVTYDANTYTIHTHTHTHTHTTNNTNTYTTYNTT